MGRKSSAKTQVRSAAPPPPPSRPTRSFTSLLVVAFIVAAAVIGGLVYLRSASRTPEEPASTSAAQTPAPAPVAEVPEVDRKPHPQQNLPPLPFSPSPPARPAEVVRAAYKFAAEHPEVLSYVPCYCGCERSGHRGNEDCFVTARDANGDVTEWEPHGMT